MSHSVSDSGSSAASALEGRTIFFVGGCQKSGTTWLQHLLNAHEQVACRGEGHLADLLLPLLKQAFDAYNGRQGQRSPDLRVFLGSPDLLATARMLGARLLAGYLADDGGGEGIRAIGDKTPEHAAWLATLMELFPAARFIHVIRDGRDACISGWFHLHRQGKAGRFPSLADYADYFAHHHWRAYITAARTAATALGDRYLEVRYEALHAEGQAEARRVLALLGVDDTDQAVASCLEGGSFERLSGGRQRGEEDASSFYRKGIVGDWRAHFDEPAIARFRQRAGDLLVELGYELAAAAAPA
jgi:hypothetical protein